MAKEKIQLAELADLISARLNINSKSADDFLKALVSVIEDNLLKNEQVKIKGLGTFKLIWNEPRKSVDVNTGADIIIDGYFKVGFSPEAGFKEIVNEPYAHLQAISLDEIAVKPEIAVKSEKPVSAEKPVVAEKPLEEEIVVEDNSNSLPLKMLHEQANEIKGILSEIKALRKTESKAEVPAEEKNVIIPVALQDVQPEIKEDIQPEIVQEIKPEIKSEAKPEIRPEVVQPIVQPEIKQETAKTPVTESQHEVLEKAEPEVQRVEQHYKPIHDDTPGNFRKIQGPHFDQAKIDRQVKTPGKRLDVIFILLMVAAAAIYMLSDMDIFSEFSKFLKSSEVKVEKVREPVYQEAVLPDTTSITEDTLHQPDVKVEDAEPVDTLEMLFNTPRVYKQFIASEEVRVGSRLARIAERYYGVKDFWVYIYEANREKFNSPDDVEPGTMLRIPKLDPRIADPNNKRCLEYARKLHDQYVKK